QPLLNLRFLFGAHLAYEPGSFYSPICEPRDLERYYRDPRASQPPEHLPGIDLNEQGQRDLWEAWRVYVREFPFPEAKTPSFRYYWGNRAFGIGDATVLYCMLRHLRPRRFIEIGSGFSSACALDTIEHHLPHEVGCTFIEPHPELLYSLINSADRKHTIIPKPVQEVPLEVFD